MNADGLPQHGIMQSAEHKTTTKTRVIGNNHQLLRVDDETIKNLSGKTESDFIQHCIELIKSEKPDVIIFEDYDKGVITQKLIEAVTGQANSMHIPVTVDPKKNNFHAYRNVALFKPNFHELLSGLHTTFEKEDTEALTQAIEEFRKKQQIGMVMVTLSEAGVFIADNGYSALFPAHIRSIADVSGAGDTVISVASMCVAAKLPASVVAKLSNLAGGLVCEEVGVVPVNKSRLTEEAEKKPSILQP
jgi:rfaE bifunctional protein kinase chain/domain